MVSGQCKFGALINSILWFTSLVGLVPRSKNCPLFTSKLLNVVCIWSSINLSANLEPTNVIWGLRVKRFPIKPEWSGSVWLVIK